jgi:glutamine synthetase
MTTKAKRRAGQAVARRASLKKEKSHANGLEELEAWFAERGIRQVKVGAFDIDGVFRGKYISLEKFLSAAQTGLGFCDVVFGWDLGDALYDNAQVTGWHTGYPDAHARVDLSSGRIIPWEPDTAAFLLDFVNPDGSAYPACPRRLLHTVGQKARKMGFLPKFGAEFEYFIFRETPQTLREKGFANLTPLTPGMFGYSWLRSSSNSALVHALLDGCNGFGIEIEGMHTETGPGVYETAIRYDDLEAAADKAALFKTVVKEICARHGVTASFMAKWNSELPGCSGHVHQSLWDLAGENNLFFDERDRRGMSKTFRHYIGGQLSLMPELTAFYWPTINSYKRGVENTWAPTGVSWGFENRTTALRVIGTSKKSMRVEYRQMGADMNPYIGMAVSLAAGLWGIANRVEPGESVEGNGYRALSHPLPRSLKDAVALLRRSERVKELLGNDFVDHFARTREWEVRQFERAVTNWELERYLELI